MNGKKSTAGNSVLSVFTGNTGIIGVLVILCVVVALATDKFLTPSNIISVLRQISINTYIALGMTLIIILGHIDLAVGAIVAMSGTLTVGFVVNQGLPIGVAIAAGIIIGVVAGLIDGMVVSKFRVPAFIITMAMMNVCNGIAYVYSGGQSTRITDKFFIAIGTGYLFNIIPLPVVYMIILIIVFSFLLSKTKFGTYVYAIGGNREAARLSGVPIKKVEIIVFTLSGALAAFAGLVLASRMYSGQPSVGSGYEMDGCDRSLRPRRNLDGRRTRTYQRHSIRCDGNRYYFQWSESDRCQLLLAADCKRFDHCLRGCTGFSEGQSGTPQKKEIIPKAHLERQGEKNGFF